MPEEKRLNWQALLKKNRLLILGLIGMAFIGLSGMITFGKSDSTEKTVSSDTTASYAENLEKRLESMLKQVRGAGNCRVMVTMEQGTEYIYARRQKNTADASQTSEDARFSAGSRTTDEQTYIMVSTDHGDQPLLLTELAPKVKGVVVVTGGAAEESVVADIQNALATVLDIAEDRICVVSGS